MIGKTSIGCFVLVCYVAVTINGKNVPITPNLKNLNKDFLSREGGGSAKPKQGTVATPAVKPGAVTSLAASALKPGIVAAPPRDSKPAVSTPTADPKAATPPKDNKPVPVATSVAAKPAPVAAKPAPVAAKPAPVAVKPAPVSANPALTKPVATPTPKPSNVKELINYYDNKSKDSYSEVARRGKTIVITAAVKRVNKEFLLREREFLLEGALNNLNGTKDANTSPKSSPPITTPTAVETTPSTVEPSIEARQPLPAKTLASPSPGEQTVAVTKPAATEIVTVATPTNITKAVAVTIPTNQAESFISTPTSVPKDPREHITPVTKANASNVQELIMYFDGKQ